MQRPGGKAKKVAGTGLALAGLVALSGLLGGLTSEGASAFRYEAASRALPDAAPAPLPPAPEAATQEEEPRRIVMEVSPGDTLSTLFEGAGLGQSTLLAMLEVPAFRRAGRNLRPGQTLVVTLDQAGEPSALAYQRAEGETLHLKRDGGKYHARTETRAVERRQRFVTGTIRDSLFAAASRAGLREGLVMEMAGIFGWDIDFALDIREGDEFAVLYEELWRDGEHVGDGAILAAEFTNQGRTVRAVRYTDADGRNNYYTPDGRSMRKTFMRSPVEFTRISSSFGNRKHPVLNRMRRHNGVDYAARSGTPIRATGEGRVIFAGRKGGYGNTLVIRHAGRYTTLYAHMSGFARGVYGGARVEQGQTIGYVGQSGLATGPHLHYEFRVNGVHRNPVTVDLPRADPIDPAHRAAFEARAEPLLSRLDLLQRTRLAASESEGGR
ncbi:Murein DD-endopeptidase MepM and murein hydrolase activator NlpD, contain LysM domain [Thiohalospira halophila DSM 15071]|uniref:Murein DD-endopeptidase MepM and murein hydrolase activator NlpD, contain LysM domain n=1 Tax=Thiohalospira halophila DSM 15071 TaxID=1123397 RepID=A0A1I1UTQ8_9GAMM|nr:peptidoglycan DD-metalloendopeptidase family protein [Thiohalospira halophila]SFD74146.1 Murein DD-endopeptidase MepM and murein hydrolase activator NlpD, contain LysM domain [Thiohalospira halophila DSM 15071]